METNSKSKFKFVQVAGDEDRYVVATEGAQYVFRVRQFASHEDMRKALEEQNPDDRPNILALPEHNAWLELLGNMQHIPLERLDLDDVYRDIQEAKLEAAEWLLENGLLTI